MKDSIIIHPAWLRITHWVNAVAALIMIVSGWRIYNADPFFGFKFPNELTLGGWLAGGVQWHFAAISPVNTLIRTAAFNVWRRCVTKWRWRASLNALTPS